MEVYLSLGTNLGDRERNMRSALKLLDRKLGVHHSSVSDFIETEPWGFKSDSRFLNAAVRYDIPENCIFPQHTAADRKNAILIFGLHLLDVCKEIERELGRRGDPLWDESGRRIYTDRPIDIDILFIGIETISHERLTVPHRDIAFRDFVRIPLAQIISENIRAHYCELFQGK